MSQKFNLENGPEQVGKICQHVLFYKIGNGFDVSSLKVYLLPKMAEALNLGDSLTVEYQNKEYIFPVVQCDFIKEKSLGEGEFESSIYIENEDWIKYRND